MQFWQYLLLCAAGALLLLLRIHFRRVKLRRRKEQAFAFRVETVLLPRETVKCVCPGRDGRWVLTSRRLLMEDGEGFFAVPFPKLKRLEGRDGSGKATLAPAKMASLTVNGEYTLRNTCDEFPEFARQLKSKVNKPAKGAKGAARRRKGKERPS